MHCHAHGDIRGSSLRAVTAAVSSALLQHFRALVRGRRTVCQSHLAQRRRAELPLSASGCCAQVTVYLNPQTELSAVPLKSFYRYVIGAPLEFGPQVRADLYS